MIRWKSVVVSTAALALAALAVAAPAGAQSTRPTVAILDLDYGTIQHWWEGNWDIGKGVADLIVDGLVEDGSFRMIERKRLDAILADISRNELDPGTPLEQFFVMTKQATIRGYYSSEIGIHRELRYKGNQFLQEFVGCATEDGKDCPHCLQKPTR